MRRTMAALVALGQLVGCALVAGLDDHHLATDTSSGGGGPGAEGGAGGSGGAAPCSDAASCPGQDTTCRLRTCEQGMCGFMNAAATTPCSEDGGVLCDGNGACVTAALGESCSSDAGCESDHCADGVCCDLACDGLCEGCNVAGSIGSCVAHSAGSDPDDDCGIAVCNAAGTCTGNGEHLYSHLFGDANNQFPRGIDVGPDGGPVVVGYSEGAIDFGGGPVDYVASHDIFVVKLDAAGNHAWSHGFGSSLSDHANGVAIDPTTGDVVVVGYNSADIDFGDGVHVSQGGSDAFVVRFDVSGNLMWSKSFGGALAQAVDAVAFDNLGNIIVAGEFQGSFSVGGPQLTTTNTGRDIWLAKLDASGNHLWSNAYATTGSGWQLPRAVAVDAANAIALVGDYENAVSFNGGAKTLTNAGGRDLFVLKVGSGGAYLWSDGYGGSTGVDQAMDVLFDAAGNVLLAGVHEAGTDFGGGVLPNAGGWDLFVAKLDAGGNHIWSNSYGSPAQDAVNVGLAIGPSGNLLLAGGYQTTITVGANMYTSNGGYDLLMVAIASTGSDLWSASHGASGLDAGMYAAADSWGNWWVAGRHLGEDPDYGGGTLSNAGGFDVSVMKYAP